MALHFRSLVGRTTEAEVPGRLSWRPSRPQCLPRASCRFQYLPRPDGLGRRQFGAACLLHAEHRAPFLQSGRLILTNRDGAAIWWWEMPADDNVTEAEIASSGSGFPESVCRRLCDGWHHLELESGFEAVCVRKGLIVASSWQRTPFDGRAWRAFADDQGEGVICPHTPPPITSAPFPETATLLSTGKMLVQVDNPGVHALAIGAVLSAAACGWMLGEAAQLEKSARIQIAETERLKNMLSNYELFDRVRKEQAELDDARVAAGSGRVGLALADVLELAASQNLQVRSFAIDNKELELVLRMPGAPAKLRILATKVEALPAFSNVSGRQSDIPGTTALIADVAV